jgi:hypothetical protein
VRSYSDVQLTTAVANSQSWRGVLRALGLPATSAAALRSTRRQADGLGLDYSHFTGQRRWSEPQLIDAVRTSTNWAQVAAALGLAAGTSTTTLRGHSVRLGLDLAHFTRVQPPAPGGCALAPDAEHLPRAGALMAAAWFELCGCAVSWPLEPCPYDLVVSKGAEISRVQVKTTRHRSGSSWRVKLVSSTRVARTYDPDDIDDLFVVAADGAQYLIPFTRVAGRSEITLSAYDGYRVPGL